MLIAQTVYTPQETHLNHEQREGMVSLFQTHTANRRKFFLGQPGLTSRSKTQNLGVWGFVVD